MTEYASGAAAPELLTAVPVPIAGAVLPAPPGERPKPLGDKPGRHVFGHFYVTNSSAGNVVIFLEARLRKYATEYAHVLNTTSRRKTFLAATPFSLIAYRR